MSARRGVVFTNVQDTAPLLGKMCLVSGRCSGLKAHGSLYLLWMVQWYHVCQSIESSKEPD